jgi:hypothetical protein
MGQGNFPRKMLRAETALLWGKAPPFSNPANCIARVFLKNVQSEYPRKERLKTRYSQGSFATWLAGPELVRAYSEGCILQFGSFQEYDCQPLFRDWSAGVLALRAECQAAGNTIGAKLSKRLANALYGKLAQWGFGWQDRPDKIAPEAWSTWYEGKGVDGIPILHRSIGRHVQQHIERTEPERSIPAIAAFVTSYGRELMQQFRAVAGPRNVYYQVVDALIVNQQGLDNLQQNGHIHETQPGKLRITRVADELDIRNLGDYRHGGHEIVVGRKANANVFADGSWSQAQFDKVGELFTASGRAGVLVQEVHCQPHLRHNPPPSDTNGWLPADYQDIALEAESASISSKATAALANSSIEACQV